MSSTPEGKVKNKVKRLLKKYGDRLYKFWPVPFHLQSDTLDILLCVNGNFLAIETKAPGGWYTPRQLLRREEIIKAGGSVFLIDGEGTEFALLDFWLWMACNVVTCEGKSETPDSGGAV